MPKKRKQRKPKGRFGRRILWGAALFFAGVVYFCYDLPSINSVKPLETKPSIVVQANDGTLIARYGGLQGNTVHVTDLPPYVAQAVLSVEDRRFYRHYGIDPFGLLRAMWSNLKARRWVQGGSTITQQLAKNVFLTPDKTLRRKAQEAVMAFQIEYKYSKNDILTAYLNRVYFGAGAYGIDAAAKTYFAKPATQLTLWESAVLVGLLKAPSRYSPATNPELARSRAAVVLEEMVDAGYIDAKKTAREIKSAKPTMVGAGSMTGDFNRYFADWVVDQIDSFITTTDGDIVVKTTLDPRLQAAAEQKQKAIFSRIKPEDQVSQAALVTEAQDGAILAMTGGVSYKTSQFNRATQAQRQPGSAFKPFVYLAALESGMTPDDLIDDMPIREGSYRPDNYDGKYYGTVSLTLALAKSLNTATVRLLHMVGVDRLVNVISRMGFSGDLPPELSTGLGTAEVSLLELTNAYTIIANGGYMVWPYAVLSIKDGQGQLLYQHGELDRPRVFASGDIAALDGMLEQVVAQGTGEAAQLSHGHVAGKTGTTQNYRDAWFMGYTDHLVTGVWMGNDDNTSMQRITGGKYPAQLWRDYMSDAVRFDVPRFVPESTPDDDGFSGFFDQWSSGAPGVSRTEPVYNK